MPNWAQIPGKGSTGGHRVYICTSVQAQGTGHRL